MLFKLFVVNYFLVCAFCKINIDVGLCTFLNIAKAIFKLDKRTQNAYAGAKDCASEGFCIRLASYKRLSNVQID